ncbi:uncharacterized protein N7443_004660 [Penicillium atrosanguineum]|uniref:uncharacterized protein n=1 Tax=Penicillium atrosanguineum TaxID=1132637 RepID=UPI00238A1A33|nr:uncharacterized protein N7443_004660 [Penicillium atrosanguineum]KAJ5133715.1 hypothetical protein N7526_005080 [Penicillium atrosanguineum]KAJ5305000.1 hypothetical protein N7443_004660 [Penicillium atrosanguineum]
MLKLSSTSATNGTHMTADPLNLIHVAADFKDKIVFDGLLFRLEIDEDGSEMDVKSPSLGPYHALIGASTVAFAFGLISALWQHINSSATASMAETLNYGLVTGHVGPAAMALAWIGVALIGLVAFGFLIMLISIRLLKNLTDDE